MDIGAIFLILAILILVGLYLYAPFLRRGRSLPSEEYHEISAWLAERDRVINALQELEFDFHLGKITPEDYPLQRAELLQKGADILRKLDELAPPTDRRMQGSAARIEQAVAARSPESAGGQAGLPDDDLESLIAARRKEHGEKSAGFCPRCGKPILVTDRFCPSCGKSLS